MKLISTTKTPPATSTKTDGVVPLSQVGSPKTSPLQRLQTGLADRNWGTASEPGIVPRSVSLFFGKIGAGNSTFFLQLLSAAARVTGRKVLYIMTTEEASNVQQRAERLGSENANA